jgi:hypothetical protein
MRGPAHVSSSAGNDSFDCRQGQTKLSGDLVERDPSLACRTNGANPSWGKAFSHVFGPPLLNEPTAGGVVFWRLFWRKKASPPRLCGHHYNKPLDRVVTPKHDHALEIVRGDVGRANGSCRCKRSHRWRWCVRHGVDAEEVGL